MGRACPLGGLARRLEALLEAQAGPKVVYPDLKTAIAVRPAQDVVTCVFDHKTNIVGLCELDTSLDV